MRFLHTSDWHIGKTLRNLRRDGEFRGALEEVLTIARTERVDCLLVAGDVFDSAVPPPEAERIAFDFFRELAGAGIPAVIVGGNHDHPKRLNAFARILDLVDIHVRGEPALPGEGGVVEVRSRDGSETAVVAVLPWVNERKVRDWDALLAGGETFGDYAEQVARMIEHVCAAAFRPDAVNLLVGHVMMDGAIVGGEGSGERPLHVGQTYAVKPQRLPAEAQYIALGHLHRAQVIRPTPPVRYSGSLLQLDFGEAGQAKSVTKVEVSPGRPALWEEIPLNAGRPLRDLGTSKAGISLDDLRLFAGNPEYTDAYLRVFLQVDRPLPGLADQVRELLPSALDIIPLYAQTDDVQPREEELIRLSPQELFVTYHDRLYGGQPPPPIMEMFLRLYEEVVHEA
ncbi:MAG: exonuclease SbcCD subunit D C-terminal domain-containing protein [Chloroflexi bacterium]|nr:exonuclease SbcCD subunit D C-terminal domain-containing protein [Chloroflexota bacterium]